MRPDIQAILTDPHHLLHQIDAQQGRVTFFPTDRERLARPSFIDGRSDFSAGPPVGLPLEEVLAVAGESGVPAACDRTIFHVSFCGSTLLARMLELPGTAFLLKEPNALVDLANWKRSGGANDRRFRPCLDLVRASLGRRWSPDEPIIVKPSNWANNLIEELAAEPDAIRPTFVTMDRRPFLTAVLRGGRDRLAFTARAAQHLAATAAEAALLREAVSATADPLGRAANLAMVTLHLQVTMFDAAMRRGGWDGRSVIDAEELTSRPVEAALKASRMLELDADPDRLADHAAAKARGDSKNPGRAFQPEAREAENDEIERHHGAVIAASLGWAERALPAHPQLSGMEAPPARG